MDSFGLKSYTISMLNVSQAFWRRPANTYRSGLEPAASSTCLPSKLLTKHMSSAARYTLIPSRPRGVSGALLATSSSKQVGLCLLCHY